MPRGRPKLKKFDVTFPIHGLITYRGLKAKTAEEAAERARAMLAEGVKPHPRWSAYTHPGVTLVEPLPETGEKAPDE